MWKIEGDEFIYKETVTIDAPLPVVYKTVANVAEYSTFLADIERVELEPGNICRLIIRVGPLRVEGRTKATYIDNERVDFVMVEGPHIDELKGSWELLELEDGTTSITFNAFFKAGKAGNWILKTASRYVEKKALSIIDAFRERIYLEMQKSIHNT